MYKWKIALNMSVHLFSVLLLLPILCSLTHTLGQRNNPAQAATEIVMQGQLVKLPRQQGLLSQ